MLTAKTPNANPDELLEQARHALKSGSSELPALLMSAANKAIAEIAPGEDPEKAALRLAAEWNDRHIKAAYTSLLWYYKDSLNPSRFCDYDYQRMDNLVDVAEDLLEMLKEGNDNA